MAAFSDKQLGNGITLVCVTSSFTAYIERFDELPSPKVGRVETTDMTSTTARTFISEQLEDPGELKLTIYHNPDNVPTLKTAEVIKVVYAAIGTHSASADARTGFFAHYQPKGEINKEMMAQVTIVLSGPNTHTNAV